MTLVIGDDPGADDELRGNVRSAQLGAAFCVRLACFLLYNNRAVSTTEPAQGLGGKAGARQPFD